MEVICGHWSKWHQDGGNSMHENMVEWLPFFGVSMTLKISWRREAISFENAFIIAFFNWAKSCKLTRSLSLETSPCRGMTVLLWNWPYNGKEVFTSTVNKCFSIPKYYPKYRGQSFCGLGYFPLCFLFNVIFKNGHFHFESTKNVLFQNSKIWVRELLWRGNLKSY